MKKIFILYISLFTFSIVGNSQRINENFKLTSYLKSSKQKQVEKNKEILFASPSEINIVLDSIFNSKLCDCSCNYRKDKFIRSCQLLFFMSSIDRIESIIWDYTVKKLNDGTENEKMWANCFLVRQEKPCNSKSYHMFIDGLPRILLEYDSSNLYYTSDLMYEAIDYLGDADKNKCNYLVSKMKKDTLWRMELAQSLIVQYNRYKSEDYINHVEPVLELMSYVPDKLTTEFAINYLKTGAINFEIADLIQYRIREEFSYPETMEYDSYLGDGIYLSDKQIKYLKTRLTIQKLSKNQAKKSYYNSLIEKLKLK